MTDIVAWGDKARSLLKFATEAHNATWDSDDGLVQAGSSLGGALLLSFAVECALKALLEAQGTKITKDLKIHGLYKLYAKLGAKTHRQVSIVYESLVSSDRDEGLRVAAAATLKGCLRNHDNSFKRWRYDVGNAGRFYPFAMICACVSMSTLVYPTQNFSVGSLTSPRIEVLGGGGRMSVNP